MLLYVEHVCPGRTLEGYEINETAAAVANELCQLKGINVKNTDIFTESLQGDLFILFNPFSGKLLEKFLNQLVDSAPTTVLYINLYDDHVRTLNELKHVTYKVIEINKPLLGVDMKRVAVIEVLGN